MARLVKFEDLTVWRRARVVAGEIFRITSVPPLAREFTLKDQLRRAAVSVPSNIAEGFESNSLPSFLRYLRIAKASLAELRCQLYVALDAGLIGPEHLRRILSQAEELSRMLGGLIKSLDKGARNRSR